MANRYRVFQETHHILGSWLSIRDCFYPNRDSVVPNSCTDTPTYPAGDTISELREDLQMMLHALDEPVLVLEDRGITVNASKPRGRSTDLSDASDRTIREFDALEVGGETYTIRLLNGSFCLFGDGTLAGWQLGVVKGTFGTKMLKVVDDD